MQTTIFHVALFLPLIANAASSSLRFVPSPGPADAYQRVASLPNGSVLIVGGEGCNLVTSAPPPFFFPICGQGQLPSVEILDSSGTLVGSSIAFGRGTGTVVDAAVDPSGNIWIAGKTDSDDFPLVHPLFAQKPPYQATGFVAKLDPKLNILFSTFLGGQYPPLPGDTASTPTSIAVDSSGNVYVAGYTGDPGFPVTGPVFGAGAPGPNVNSLSPLVYAFIAKMSSDGSKLMYSRLIGGDQMSCQASPCFSDAARTAANALAVDTGGNVTIAGDTTASNFPATPAAFQNICNCLDETTNGFVTRISSDGSKLIWSTYLAKGSDNPLSTSVTSLTLDASGNIYVAGSTNGSFVATPGALQPSLPTLSGPNGFAAKLSSDGTRLLAATNLGGSSGANLSGLTIDSKGNVWVSGTTTSPDFPGLPNTPASGSDFALELDDAYALKQIVRLPPGTATQPPAFDSAGGLLLLSFKGSLLRLDSSASLSAPAVFAITNAAVLRADAGVTAGALATLFGVGLGPSSGIVASPDPNGVYPTQLGGVKIQFVTQGGPPVEAPLLYVGPNQINFQVPWNALGNSDVTITTPTATLAPILIWSIASTGVFHRPVSPFAAALNQNLSVNSSTNPAHAGSIISLYSTGECGEDQLAPNGAIWNLGDRNPDGVLEIAVFTIGLDEPLPVLYFGPAPGLINGVCQINVRLPDGAENPTLTVYQIRGNSLANTGSLQLFAPSNTFQVYA